MCIFKYINKRSINESNESLNLFQVELIKTNLMLFGKLLLFVTFYILYISSKTIMNISYIASPDNHELHINARQPHSEIHSTCFESVYLSSSNPKLWFQLPEVLLSRLSSCLIHARCYLQGNLCSASRKAKLGLLSSSLAYLLTPESHFVMKCVVLSDRRWLDSPGWSLEVSWK